MQNPWIIYGFAPNNGINVKIVGKNLTTNEEEVVFSSVDGSFIIDAANMLPSGYSAELGDKIRITSGEYYAEVIVNVELYPDGIQVVLTNNPVTMAAVIPSGVMAKFPKIDDWRMGLPGSICVGRGGLG